jgi:hypothetical protein
LDTNEVKIKLPNRFAILTGWGVPIIYQIIGKLSNH